MQPVPGEMRLCSSHGQCESRLPQIKLTKGFAAKEPVRGHMASSFFRKNLNGPILFS